MMLVAAEGQTERNTELAKSVAEILDGPGQKQMGAAGHAPPPSIPTPPIAFGRTEHKPLFLSRPTFSVPALSMRALPHHLVRVSLH